MEVREYQREVLEEIDNLIETGEISFFLKASMGTGKTFMLSEFAKKYKDKRPCLVIGPKESIKAFNKDFEPEFEFCGYEMLYSIYKSNIEDFKKDFYKKYSIIIIDEAHKSGAKEYGKPIADIKKNGSYDYFVGASAHNRRLDQIHVEEDQCDILFDGNLVGDLDLDYCFENKILIEPRYFYCEANLNETIKSEIEKLRRSKLPKYLKTALIEKLETVKLTNENYSSLDKTLRNSLNIYKDIKNLKIVVFISRISDYETIKNLIDKSMQNIFSTPIKYYSYFNGDSKKNLDNFINNDGINVLFSVNRANLSVHHPDLKVCILYRKTVSAIVFEQQIGRVLSHDTQGTIIDIVDNGHTVKPIQYSGEKLPSSYIINSNRKNTYSFNDIMNNEFELHYCSYKRIIELIKMKKYMNISVEYNGESNTIMYFADKYKKVRSDVFFFLSKDIPFNRALEASRTEYFIKINDKEYSASLIAKRFNINGDQLRFDIKNNKFKLNEDMKEFFDIPDDSIDEITEKINELNFALAENEKHLREKEII